MSNAYPPSHHLLEDPAALLRLVETLRLATLLRPVADDLQVAFVPMLVERHEGAVSLLGHVDAANPQAQDLDGARLHAVFHGPHAYISPDDYRTSQLPTWNYIHVVAEGIARELKTREERAALLVRMSETFGGGRQDFVLGEDEPRMHAMLDCIRAFRLEITRLTGRIKLSQDKSEEDRDAALVALARRADARRAAVFEWVRAEGIMQ